MEGIPDFTDEQIAAAKFYVSQTTPVNLDPRLASLGRDLIGRVADKWTMMILDVLAERSPLRFSRLGAMVEGISQKMPAQILRAMESDGIDLEAVENARQAFDRTSA